MFFEFLIINDTMCLTEILGKYEEKLSIKNKVEKFSKEKV